MTMPFNFQKPAARRALGVVLALLAGSVAACLTACEADVPSRALLVVAETVTVDAAPHPDEPHPPTASTTDAGIPDEPLAVPAR